MKTLNQNSNSNSWVKIFAGVIMLFSVCVQSVFSAARVASVSGNWSATATWGGASVPTLSDDVTINNGITVTVDQPAECNTLSTVNTGGVTISGTNSLAVTGLITMERPSANNTNFTIAVGAGALTSGGLTMKSTTTTRNNIISISTGSVTINGTTTNGTTGCRFIFSDAGTLVFNGDFADADNPTITTTTGSTVVYSYAGAQTVRNATYYHLTLSGSGVKTLSASTTTINGNLTFGGTASATATVGLTIGGNLILGAGTSFNGASFTHNVSGNFTNNGGTFTPSTSTIRMSGSGKIIGGTSATSFYNLTINNAGGAILGADQSVSNTLTLTSGRLTLGAYHLTLGASANAVAGTLNASNMIVADGSGTLRKIFSAAGSYIFPIGDATVTAEYSPLTLNFASGTFAGGAYAAVNLTNAKHASISSISNYLTRYWTVSESGITAYSCTLTGTYAVADLVGSYNNMITTKYNAGWSEYGAVTASTVTATGLTSFGDFTGMNNGMIATPSSLYGFTYQESFGPSAEQTFTVYGQNLTDNIVITPTARYEISTTSGAGYQSTPLTLVQTAGNVDLTTIYIRMKAGEVMGAYAPENVVVSSTGKTSVNVACSGIITPNVTIASDEASGAYCSGSNINFTTTPSSLTSYSWTGPNGYTSSAQNPSLSNSTTSMSGTYTMTGTYVSPTNLIVNGDFEAGNVSFSSSYTNSADLSPEGRYAVVNSPTTVHPAFSSCGDHTTGTGKQMVINGATVAGVAVWSQTVSVVPGASYQFSYWVQTVHVNNPSRLQLSVNGVLAGTPYTVVDANCQWQQFIYDASAGNSSTVVLSLENQNTVASGNDFALDDIKFNVVLTTVKTIDVNVGSSDESSVTVVASANPINAGESVTFTATPGNGGSAPVYQWKVNGNNVGTNSATFTSTTIENGDVVTCEMVSNESCSSSPNAVSDPITMEVRNFWLGSVDTDWGKAANWTANMIPNPGQDVVFATLANFGAVAMNDLRLDQDRTIGNLTNLTTRQLYIPASFCLTINNNVTTDGNSDRIYLQASETLPTGSLIIPNATGVKGTAEMYTKGFLYNGRYKWQYFGVPMKEVVASPTFDGSIVRIYNEAIQGESGMWVAQTAGAILPSFTGYEISQTAPRTIVVKGEFENRDYHSGKLNYTLSSTYKGWHLIGNPYSAAIDITQIEFGSSDPGIIENTVYLFNSGSRADWEGAAGTPGSAPGYYTPAPIHTAGIFGIPGEVPSTSAIMVSVKSDNPLATVSFTYNSVITKNTEMKRAKANNKICTRIDVVGATASNRLWLFTNPTSTRCFDNGWDVFKMNCPSNTPNLFAVEQDGSYQIDAISDIDNTILGLKAGLDAEYLLKFAQLNTENRYDEMYLIDLTDNKVIDIVENGTEYRFSAQPYTTNNARFKIVTSPVVTDGEITTSNDNAKSNQSKIDMKVYNNTVFVDNHTSSNGVVLIFNAEGKLISKNSFLPTSVNSYPLDVQIGTYIAKCVTETETITLQFIVK